jgi:hypothetical protein
MAQTERQKYTHICMRNQSAPVGAIRGKNHSMMKSSADKADRAAARAKSKLTTAQWSSFLRRHTIRLEDGLWCVRNNRGDLLSQCVNIDTACSSARQSALMASRSGRKPITIRVLCGRPLPPTSTDPDAVVPCK